MEGIALVWTRLAIEKEKSGKFFHLGLNLNNRE